MKAVSKLSLIGITLAAILLVLALGVKMENHITFASNNISNKREVVTEGIQLSIQIKDRVVRYGEPIILELSLKNTTNAVIAFLDTGPEKEYKLVVKDEHGRDAKLTQYGENVLKNAEEVRRVVVKLQPGQKLQNTIMVNKMYDMTTTGGYNITAKRKIFRLDGDKFIEVVSNTVKVDVSRL